MEKQLKAPKPPVIPDVFVVTVNHKEKNVVETISVSGNKQWLASAEKDHPAYELMQKFQKAAEAERTKVYKELHAQHEKDLAEFKKQQELAEKKANPVSKSE